MEQRTPLYSAADLDSLAKSAREHNCIISVMGESVSVAPQPQPDRELERAKERAKERKEAQEKAETLGAAIALMSAALPWLTKQKEEAEARAQEQVYAIVSK